MSTRWRRCSAGGACIALRRLVLRPGRLVRARRRSPASLVVHDTSDKLPAFIFVSNMNQARPREWLIFESSAVEGGRRRRRRAKVRLLPVRWRRREAGRRRMQMRACRAANDAWRRSGWNGTCCAVVCVLHMPTRGRAEWRAPKRAVFMSCRRNVANESQHDGWSLGGRLAFVRVHGVGPPAWRARLALCVVRRPA
jgi:hypothetical protein